jgi:hypothetical protein
MDTGQPGGSDLRRELELLHRESFGWALACCAHDVSTAETVLQTVYLKILEGKARFDGRARLKTWLFAVIRNTAAEERRHQILGRLRLFPVALLQDLPAPQEDVGRTLYCSEVRTLFRKALGGLPLDDPASHSRPRPLLPLLPPNCARAELVAHDGIEPSFPWVWKDRRPATSRMRHKKLKPPILSEAQKNRALLIAPVT